MVRPFRFIAPVPPLVRPLRRWQTALRRIEELGFDSVAISDHFTRGWQLEPVVGLVAAAAATRRLRLLSLVFANDYRHPVLLHKAAASIDVLSGGRLELGLGAGWMASEYGAAGMRFDPPRVRVDRLAESVQVLKKLFGPEPVTFTGAHYEIRDLQGLPGPVQLPHPPILIGGGGRRILQLAAREADIVGVHSSLRHADLVAGNVEDLRAQRISEKLAWLRQGADAAGRRMDDLELQFTVYACEVTDAPRAERSTKSSFAAFLESDPTLMAESPAVLRGTVSECVDLLQERRERYGFSYLHLGADVEAVAPIVKRLAGT